MLANFERPVLGCIEAVFASQYSLKLLTRPAKFTHFCTAPNSNTLLHFVKHFRNSAVAFSKFQTYLFDRCPKFTNFDEIIPAFAAFQQFLRRRSKCPTTTSRLN